MTLGERVAGEWAKENSCRRIRTGQINLSESGKPSIQEMAARLQAGAAADTGDGSALEKAIASVEATVNRALGAPP